MVQMLMSGGGSGGDDQEKVVVVITTCMVIDQTAGCGWSGIKWLANAVSLKPGDHLILVALLHLTNNPRTLSFHAAAKLLGYKGKEDPSEIFGSTSRLDEEELRRRKEEFKRNHGIIQLQKLYEIQKVKVSVEVEAGPSRKVAAVKAAKRLRATWIVLDREMKKDKHYFMDRLSCGISSMKSNNTITEIRGPISEHVSYDEMIPSYSWEDIHLSSSPSPSPSKSPGKSKATTISRKSELSKSSTRTTSLHDHNSQQKSTSSIPSSSNYFKDINTYTTTTTTTTTSMNPKQALKALQEKLSRSPRRPSSKSAKHENKQSLASRTGESSAGNKIDDINNNNDNKNQKEKEFENSICSVCKNKRPRVYLQRDFSYAEIREATKGFSRNNFLSEGGFGFVFEGELKDGLKIAAKQHKAASLQGEKEFKSEVHLLSQARHQNVVVLLGSCSEGSHRLLVYEYVCNGSLEQHLSGSLPHLTWEQRMKIALGAAKGLEYLHSRNIVHRDMRPGNILITHDHESLLGDFGLAKEHHDGTTHHSSDKGVVGTLGYVAPEYAESGKMSTKTDVYSFGVVLLQLITGLSTTDEIPGGKSLVGWAKPLLETKNYPDLIDKRIAESHDVLQLFWMVLVAEKCLKKKPDNRWTMKQVVHNLTCIKEGKTNFIIDFPPT